ncbi:MAG: hypothetical protein VX460_11965 [Planctomycetota bacterium]|nr:hypothetical protein [Planctomycetota bacterium]
MRSIPRSFRQSVLVLGAVLAVACVSSCGSATHVHVPPAPPTGPVIYAEIEPNDFPDFPDFVSVLDRQSHLAVQGSVGAFGFDVVDHIEFQAAEPMELDFYLEPLTAFGDVDVSIYDPISGLVLNTYAFTGGESGTIVIHEAGRPFQFVITAFGFASDWDLELLGYPYFGRRAGAESESEDAPAASLQARGEAGAAAAEVRPWIEFVSE